MKNLFYLFLICFVLPNVIKAQGNNPCGKDWSEWRTAWSLPNGEVEFRLEFPSKKCGCGTNYVELKHSLPYSVKITVRLEGYDCDGKKYGERFFSDAIVGGEISKKGAIYHWFGSMPSAVAVILEYEEGGKKIRLEKNYAGTKKYINGMSETAYNQQQQQKSTASSTSSTTKPSGGTANNSSTNTPRPNSSTNTPRPNPSTSTSTASQQQAQLAEQQRLQREEALRKQQEAERRQREEAFRQNELRYKAQLQEINRKSEASAQRDASIMDGFAGIFSIIQKNKAERGLREDAGKRSSKLSEYEKKLAEGGYELIDCPHCDLDGYDRCAQCKSKGSIKCNICNGEAGKSCSNCSGTGKKGYGPYQVACFNCSGTGKRKCLPCGNEGSNICFLCNGRSERQCGHCEGTGKMLERITSSYSSSSTSTTYETSNEYSSTRSIAEEQAADEKAKVLVATLKQGQVFLEKNKTKPGVKTTTSGLQYQILKQGNGRRFQLGDTISYHLRLFDFQGNLLLDSYKEKQPKKDVFSDPSAYMGYVFEAFSMMPVGSRYKFFVPADLAFEDIDADFSDGKILPGGSVLVAEHELLSVKRPLEEMLKEEYRLDSILHAPIESELTMSFNEIKADSLFAISLKRSYDEKERTQVDLITSILYRESDGHFPIDAYRGKYDSYQQAEGSVGDFYYIPTLAAYQKVVRELEARAKKGDLRVFKVKKTMYMNEKPTKKRTDFAVSASSSVDAAWLAKYDSSRLLFDQEKYFDSYQLAQAVSDQTGRKNKKIQLLLVYAGYLSITNGKINRAGDGLSPYHPMNYQNLSRLNGQVKDLLALATPADSAASWLYDAKVYEEDTRSMAEDYLYQKDRTPEKAVRFLDSLEQKFEKKPMYGSGSGLWIYYSLKDSFLTIPVSVSVIWDSKRLKDEYHGGELRINLKEVELSKVAINRSKHQLNANYIFTELYKGYNDHNTTTLPVPALINVKNKSAMFYTLAEGGNFDRLRKKLSKATPLPLQTFNLFQFFNESDPRFTEEGTDQKIEETFRYLIDYFKK